MNDKVQKTPEEIEQLAFVDGFEDETAAAGRKAQPSPQNPESQAEAIKAEPPKQETKTPEAKPEAKKPVEQKPKDEFVRLTKSEYEALRTNAGKVPELEKRLETVFGKFGPTTQLLNELKGTVEALKAATPKGEPVKIPKGSFAKLRAEYSDLADLLESDLEMALSGQTGTGKSNAAPEDVIKDRLDNWGTKLEERLEERSIKKALKSLDATHPNWREITGAVPPGQQPDPKHPFRAWLATKSEAYQAWATEATDPADIRTFIKDYQDSQRAAAKTPPATKPAVKTQPAKPSKKALLRKNRFQGSVQPKGLGTPPPAQKQTDEDAFASGFRSG